MPATRPRRMLVANPRAPRARLRPCEAGVRRPPRSAGGRARGRGGGRRPPAIPLPGLDLAESLGGGVRGGPAARRAARARRRRPAGRHPAALRDRARRARAARGGRGLRLSRPHRRRRPRGRRVGGAPRVARRRPRALDPPRGARHVADRARAARARGDVAVPATSPTVRALPGLAATVGLAADVTLEERCPVLGLPSSWETYLASLSGKHRHELTRKIRRFEREAPDGRAVVVRGPDAVAARLRGFLALHRP